MNRARYEAELYESLTSREELKSQLRNGSKSIYHERAPSVGYDGCPFLVYAVTMDEPMLSADNVEIASKLKITIYVVTNDGGFGVIEREVRELMNERGAVRKSATEESRAGRRILKMEYEERLQ